MARKREETVRGPPAARGPESESLMRVAPPVGQWNAQTASPAWTTERPLMSSRTAPPRPYSTSCVDPPVEAL